MMRTLLGTLLLLLLAAACERSEPAPADAGSDSRPAVAIAYVKGEELPIHARPGDDSPVIATYGSGQSVSILSHRGAWDEVRVADRSGWAHAAALGSAAEARQSESDNLTPRFRVRPAPVTSQGAHGEIILEASVNQDGEVLDVRTTTNTTGNMDLVAQNSRSVRAARFEPIVQHGQRRAFTYEYRVHY